MIRAGVHGVDLLARLGLLVLLGLTDSAGVALRDLLLVPAVVVVVMRHRDRVSAGAQTGPIGSQGQGEDVVLGLPFTIQAAQPVRGWAAILLGGLKDLNQSLVSSLLIPEGCDKKSTVTSGVWDCARFHAARIVLP